MDFPEVPDDYRPSPQEAYMSPMQVGYFRRRLMEMRDEILLELESTSLRMREEKSREGDLGDHGLIETDLQMDLIVRERSLQTLSEIDSALQRIEEGTYGFCEETGEEIGIKRLEARPLATLCIEAQESLEQTARMRNPGMRL